MPIVDLVLPKLGESIMEATILKWHKNVGDTIQLDETLLDIATDKVDSEIPATVAGKIFEILFEPNAVVPIGTVIARIETNDASYTNNPIEAIIHPNTSAEQKQDPLIDAVVNGETIQNEEFDNVQTSISKVHEANSPNESIEILGMITPPNIC